MTVVPPRTTDTLADVGERDRAELALKVIGQDWRTAANAEVVARRVRDEAIRSAHSDGEGFGVREIARIVGMDPTSVSRVLRPRGEAMHERAEKKVARVQDVLDDAWIRLSPDAEEALKEAIA